MQAGKPNFLIIGAQKAASTTLLHALRQHRDVWMPTAEDPFLRDPVFSESALPTFLDRYGTHRESMVGLKCPDYLGRPEVPARIARHLADPKLITIVRNPVERAISAYSWQVRWGALPVTDPNEGLTRLLDGHYRALNPRSDEILDWGLYYKHLHHYLEHVDSRQMLVIHDQDFLTDRVAVMRQVYGHLGLDEPSRAPDLPVRNSNSGVYPLPRLRFLQARNGLILRWNEDRTYSTIKKPDNPALRAYSNAIAATDRWVLARIFGNEKPRVDPDIRARLSDFYAEDSSRLQELLGRRFPGWPGPEPDPAPRPHQS